MLKYNAAFLVLLLTLNGALAQGSKLNDTVTVTNSPKKTNWKKVVVTPTILISLGLFSTTDNKIISDESIYGARNEHFPDFHTNIDDYLQYAPIVGVYALNAFGVKGTHNLANQTALLIKAELLMSAMVFPLKEISAVPRPDTGTPNSFPSGHTAQAFVAATFLHKEYGKEHPWYSVLAYGTATAVGILRVMNNRHWASDVLVGAGIGILATNLVYLTHQNKWGRKHNKTGIVWAPSYGQRTFTLNMVIPINGKP